MVSRMRAQRVEEGYRIYVTDQLRLIPQMTYITTRWTDLTTGQARDDSTAEEIAERVIAKIGLEVSDGPT